MSTTNDAARKVIIQAAVHLGLGACMAADVTPETDHSSVYDPMDAFLATAKDMVTDGGNWRGEKSSTEMAKAYMQGAALIYAAEMHCQVVKHLGEVITDGLADVAHSLRAVAKAIQGRPEADVI